MYYPFPLHSRSASFSTNIFWNCFQGAEELIHLPRGKILLVDSIINGEQEVDTCLTADLFTKRLQRIQCQLHIFKMSKAFVAIME